MAKGRMINNAIAFDAKKPVPFDAKLSLQLDRATTLAEKGSKTGKLWKRYIEWKIFGGKDD